MPKIDQKNKGGTMVLSRRTNLQLISMASKLYKEKPFVLERHRHRYEVNPRTSSNWKSPAYAFRGKRKKCLVTMSLNGWKSLNSLLNNIRSFSAVQFLSEFLSRPLEPSHHFVDL